ncbi:hypothetical protein K493DRAFT_207124 [Basidiobolus meristosporus CBS 931.73]|uniref:Amino acid transporter transmembrane domain-containing protein n=1 Tax=Basidiobolus meristosporus CBS 931.73 TaxID=1314790 RepID=A0A1Y1YZG9_9FUNG|nr:hypothetical protein K493DRAFT_207124 [Basidiobolus meristosporus CBS 931.73]|eukprot:ORY03349.1 hypothetical protein K493DRAFT_207124 [Basidiobolus meristosporus CBS 931.73]
MSNYTDKEEVRDVHQLEYEDVPGHARTGSSFGAFANIVCVIAGSGTLQLPLALHQGGWFAVILIVFFTIAAIYAGNLLIKSLYYDKVSRLADYPAIAEAAFGKFGKYFIRTFNYSILLGTGCVYILLAAMNIESLVLKLGVDIGLKMWVIISAAIIWIPFVSLKSIKEIALMSAFGALATLVVVIVSVVVGFIDMHERVGVTVTHSFFNSSSIPLALASICFSFGGNVIYPHVESGMAHPKSWPKVLSMAMATICGMYVLISVCGYYVYGDTVQSPIYTSLPQTPPTYVAIIMITLHVIFAAPLYLTGFAYEVEGMLRIDRRYHSASKEFILRAILRSAVIVVLALIAMFLPYVNSLMSLIGALAYSIIIFIAPIVLYLKLYGFRSMGKIELLWCAVIVIVSAIACVLGTKDAIISLIDQVKGDQK